LKGFRGFWNLDRVPEFLGKKHTEQQIGGDSRSRTNDAAQGNTTGMSPAQTKIQ